MKQQSSEMLRQKQRSMLHGLSQTLTKSERKKEKNDILRQFGGA